MKQSKMLQLLFMLLMVFRRRQRDQTLILSEGDTVSGKFLQRAMADLGKSQKGHLPPSRPALTACCDAEENCSCLGSKWSVGTTLLGRRGKPNDFLRETWDKVGLLWQWSRRNQRQSGTWDPGQKSTRLRPQSCSTWKSDFFHPSFSSGFRSSL